MKDGKVAKELVAERDFHFFHLFRNVAHSAKHRDHGARDLPVDGFDLRLGSQIEQTEVEHRLCAFTDFVGVVEVFEAVLFPKVFKNFDDVLNNLWILLRRLRLSRRWDFSRLSRRLRR